MRIKQATKIFAVIGFISMTVATSASNHGAARLAHLKQKMAEGANLLETADLEKITMKAPLEAPKPLAEVKKPTILAQAADTTT